MFNFSLEPQGCLSECSEFSLARSFFNTSSDTLPSQINSNHLLIDYSSREFEAAGNTDLSLIPSLQEAGLLVRDYLQDFALSPAYNEITSLAFGESYNQTIASSMRQRFADENLAGLPNIEIIDSDILSGANGAYAGELNTIFLSTDFISNSDSQTITQVLLEEIGHFIDSQINTADSSGDEGNIFARLVMGQGICRNELAFLKQEDDSGFIWLNGQSIAVEQDNSLSTARNAGTLSGFRSFSDWIGSSDTHDYYRFHVDTTSNFRLNLTGLSANADVQILNSTGSVVQGSYGSGTSSELITRQLTAGTYYARIYRLSGDTTYNVALSATPVDYAGNTTSTARNVGTLSGTRGFSDWIGSVDTNDYYRFYVGTTSNFRLNLTGLRADADVQLLNSAGHVIQGAYTAGIGSELIARQLSAGTYYARIYPYNGNTNYNLSLTTTPLDYAGNTLSTARNIGTLSGTRSFTDWVGNGDTNDYYRFYVGTTSNFRLNLTGLSANADVQLFNSAGGLLQGAFNSGTSSELITRQLTTGTYYARIYPQGGNTNYNLSLTATPLDYAGNTLSTARNIGTLSGTRSFTDWVGNIDTNDYYRFYIGTTSNFRLNLTGLTADANVQLFNSAGNLIQGSYLANTSPELITRQLGTGTYYARVYPYGGNTNYNLSLTATTVLPPDYAGNTFGTARNIGTLSGTRSFTDWVGNGDTNDYYRFYVGTTSNFRLDLTGLTADADVQLLNSAGTLIQSSTFAGTNSELISRQLSSGTYYARIYPYSGNTNYNLALTATTITQPDLVIQSHYAPSSVTVGNAVNINSYTRNQGTASAGYSYVRYWLSDDATLNTGSDRYLGDNYVGSLASGTSEYDSFSFTYSSSWGTGTKYILFEADGYNYVAESNEFNNIAAAAITINGTSSYVPPTYQPFNANQVFSLQSHSSANHTIYLDFDGHITTNTLWNSNFSSSIATPAYDIDGNTSSFSLTERENIWNIWRRVAEDFIPFNVNVTTAAPPISDLIKTSSSDTRWGIRVAIGGNGAWYGGGGGVAYLNSFNWNSDTPTFVFSNNMFSAKDVAEAISHEVGHTLGLDHDGTTNGVEYYRGHNGWASIMGVGYYQELTQWSKGEYWGAQNRQDDLAIITQNNGFGYRTDDYGSSLSTASNLSFSGSAIRTYGIIERNTDVDWFRFNSFGGNVLLNINAFEMGANLDILARVYNSVGHLVATYNPTTSLSTTVSLYLSSGTYYLSVEGTGRGDSTTGYSNYGSLGQYSITGSLA